MNEYTEKRLSGFRYSGLTPVLQHLLKTFLFYYSRARQRRHLATLSDHLLDDIGYSRREAEKEASRPFWD